MADGGGCGLNEQADRSQEEGNERPFPYQAVTQFIVWKIKKEEKRKESQFCVLCHSQMFPLAATQSRSGSGFAGGVCEASLLGTKCGLWWERPQ